MSNPTPEVKFPIKYEVLVGQGEQRILSANSEFNRPGEAMRIVRALEIAQ